MKIAGHGNAVAIALAGLAVVLAATGTAYAVSAAPMRIQDAHTGNLANVDTTGHLQVVQQNSTIEYSRYMGINQNTMLTGMTTATLAITGVTFENPIGNRSYTNADFDVTLSKYTPGPSGDCTGDDGTYSNSLVVATLPLGTDYVEPFSTPQLIGPTGSKPYCLVAYLSAGDLTTPTSYQNPYATLTGYVYRGSYTNALSTAGSTRHPALPALHHTD